MAPKFGITLSCICRSLIAAVVVLSLLFFCRHNLQFPLATVLCPPLPPPGMKYKVYRNNQ